MGVTIEQWRASVGCFGASKCSTKAMPDPQAQVRLSLLSTCIKLSLLISLLAIGGVEMNPGPEEPVLSCSHCSHQTKSASQYIKHISIHSLARNSIYACPLCRYKGSAARHLEIHISRMHRRGMSRTCLPSPTIAKCSVANCEASLPTVADLIKHLKNHLSEGSEIKCPFGTCPNQPSSSGRPRSNLFTNLSTFKSHLTRNHKSLQQKSCQPECLPQVPAPGPSVGTSDSLFDFDDMDNDSVGAPEAEMEVGPDNPLPEEEENLFSTDQVCEFIARWYLQMEGDLFVPASSVQTICQGLSSIIEYCHSVMKRKMVEEMLKVNVTPEQADRVANVTLNSDPLRMTHHLNFRNVCLLTEHRRYVYYFKNFNFVKPVKEILKPVPTDEAGTPFDVEPQAGPPPNPDPAQATRSTNTVSLVPIKESLAAQLRDKQVQAEVEASFVKFSRPSPPNENKVYRDFNDGEVFLNHPGRSMPGIFLLFFCDGFGTTNPIGASKDKHKTVGIYYNLGNLPPEKRSRLDVVQLAELFLEEQLKVKGKGKKALAAKKAKWDEHLQPLVKQLRELFRDGIIFKGNRLPVHFLFMLGDNLGQHQAGGFSESFSGDFWCRFCEIASDEFEANPLLDKPLRTPQDYAACVEEAKRTVTGVSYKGVKFDSYLNSLDNYHVCLPGMPPCIGHDLFEGIVAHDMMLYVKYFISKSWFTRVALNQKIKEFDFVGTDAADKPNTIGLDSKKQMKMKLSGSAVKNWNFLRFFSLVMMDYIKDPEDPVWRLYLKLKLVSEQVCAPQISDQGIFNLNSNVEEYLEKRKTLFPNVKLKPKHHYLRHVAALIRKFGPLLRLWTLRMESFHSVLKRAARAANNFINIPVTMAFKAQLKKCFLSCGNIYRDGFTFSMPQGFVPAFEAHVLEFIKQLNLPSDSLCVNTVCVNGITYKRGMWILLERQDFLLVVGQICFIYCDDDVTFVLKKHSSSVEPNNLGLHEVNITENLGLGHVASLTRVESFYPLQGYERNGKLYLTLKHSPLPNHYVP